MSYITVRQVCAMTSLKYPTVLEWAKSGLLPARRIKHGKKSKYFFVEQEILDAIEKHKVIAN